MAPAADGIREEGFVVMNEDERSVREVEDKEASSPTARTS